MGLLRFKRRLETGINKDQLKLVHLMHEYQIDCVLDVGGNAGQYAQGIRETGYTGWIVSIEPLSRMHTILEHTASEDDNWYIAPRMALGEKSETRDINIAEASDMSSLLEIAPDTLKALPKSHTIGKERVDVYPLSDVWSDLVPHDSKNIFLKADTQGYEMGVLKGAEACLEDVTGIQLELSLFPLYGKEETYETVSLWLRKHGFEPYLVIPGYFSKKLMRQMQLDVVFFRK